MNNKPDVDNCTRVSVLQAAEFGYVADHSGRSLRQGTTNAIALYI